MPIATQLSHPHVGFDTPHNHRTTTRLYGALRPDVSRDIRVATGRAAGRFGAHGGGMTITAPLSAPSSRTFEGIACIMVGMFLFVGQDVLMKSLLGAYPVWMLIFTRSVVAVLVLTPLVCSLGAPHRLRTPLWPWHLLRAFLFASGFALFYAAFPFMNFAVVTTIFFAAPLMTALLASLFLGEQIGLPRMAALLVGFAGVIVAMNPTGTAFQWVAILPLICALTYAISQIIVRKIGDQETTLTIGLYTIAFSGVMIGPMGWVLNQVVTFGPEVPHLRSDWPMPTGEDVLWLAMLGGIGMVGYLLVSRAYQIANPSVVAPFDYTYLPFAVVIGYVLWDEIPETTTIVGMSLIILSGVFIGYRELIASRTTDQPPPTAEATFAPGNPAAPLALMTDVDGGLMDELADEAPDANGEETGAPR